MGPDGLKSWKNREKHLMTPSLHQDKKKPSKIRSKIQTYVDCTKIGRNKINAVTNKTFKSK